MSELKKLENFFKVIKKFDKNLKFKILEIGADNVMCFIAEPILASGGVIVPPADYNFRCWKMVKKYLIKRQKKFN